MNRLDFSNCKILVIGDLMLDKHIRGYVERLNPESPVPLVDVIEEDFAPGGAANTANNIASLGGKVYLMGVIGNDFEGAKLKDILYQKDINTDYVFVQEDIPTIAKIRVYAKHQQMIRFDYEKKDSVSEQIFKDMYSAFEDIIPNVDIVVISDYAKGLIKKNLMDELKKFETRIIVDPKPVNKELYKGVYLLTPNKKEACAINEIDYHTFGIDYNQLGIQLRDYFGSNVLITRGSDGMSLFKIDNGEMHIKTEAKDVFDVTGAGDTVIATLALGLASGYDIEYSSRLANKAAGIVVGKSGTSTITVDELQRLIDN